MNRKYGPLYDYDFKESSRNLRAEASKLKTEIFRATVMKKDLDQRLINNFNGFVNDYLRFWDEYSEEFQKKMRDCEATEGLGTIEYSYIKQWVYGNFDFASILPFADGVVQGVMSEKFTDPDDVEDFFEHTVSKAFNDMGKSVAGLIGNAMNYQAHPATKVDTKMFGTIAAYNKLFDSRTRTELYKAISKTVEYFTSDIGAKNFPNQKDVKMFVSMINNVVEYIVYSLTVYALRIYLIQVYGREFVFSSAKGSNSYNTESADHSDNKKEEEKKSTKVDVPSVKDTAVPDHRFVPLEVFHNTDEAVFKDYERGKEVAKVFKDFISQSGANGLEYLKNLDDLGRAWFVTEEDKKDNVFLQKLNDNALYQFLRDGGKFYRSSEANMIAETHQVLKELLYNQNQGMQGTSSPKQQLLHVIRGTTVDESLKGYQKLAGDFVAMAICILSYAKTNLNNIIEWKKYEKDSPSNNTTTDSLASECLRMLADFYRELAGAIYQRGMDIELHINDLHSSEIKNILGSFNFKVTSDLDSNKVMMSAVPDTTRLPTEMMDGYDIPSFEAMQLYDEWARSLPGMQDSFYYNEAVDISSLINALIAKIKGWAKYVSNFIQDNRFQNAAKWVTDHENDLMSMDYSGGKMQILPYKTEVTVPDVITGLVKNLAQFDVNSLKSQSDLDAFIKSLYGNDTIYGWFHGDNVDAQAAARRYRNLILFKDLNEVDDKDPQMIPLDGVNIQKNMKFWVETVKGNKQFMEGVNKISTDLERNVNNVKSKLAGLKMESVFFQEADEDKTDQKTQGESEKAADAANKVQEGDKKPEEGSESQNNQQSEADKNAANRLMTELTLATERLWGSCTKMFVTYIMNEYKYLQEAYSIGRKKQ